MTVLTADRNTPLRSDAEFTDPVAASMKIFAGAIVCLDATGNAVKGAVSTTLKARGIAQEPVDNSSGGAGALTVSSKRGCYRLANDGTITRADLGGTAWIVDDQTVADNNGTNTRSALGTIADVDAVGVWVRI